MKICPESISYRKDCIQRMTKLTSDLPKFAEQICIEVDDLTLRYGLDFFLDLLRISANIPEIIRPDSSEEKRYSKFTDSLLSCGLTRLGLISTILDARADSADVEAYQNDPQISLVGDAKAFRMSRTAKNQKDFKVSAMDKWKHGLPYALLVCPLYQLPASNSQIYYQAIERNVCILSYNHLCALIKTASENKRSALLTLKELLCATEKLTPNKLAYNYWRCINETLTSNDLARHFWQAEKRYVQKIVELGKAEALEYFAHERERICCLSREEAIKEIIFLKGIDSKIKAVNNFVIPNFFLTI